MSSSRIRTSSADTILGLFCLYIAKIPARAFQLLHLRDDVDRGGKSHRQARNSHSGANVFPSLPKNLDQKIRSPIHDDGLPVKFLGAIDQAMDGDDLLEVIERADHTLESRQTVDDTGSGS